MPDVAAWPGRIDPLQVAWTLWRIVESPDYDADDVEVVARHVVQRAIFANSLLPEQRGDGD